MADRETVALKCVILFMQQGQPGSGAHWYNAMVALLGQTGQVVLLKCSLEMEDEMHEVQRLVIQFWERVVRSFEEQERRAGHPQEEGCEAPSSQLSSPQQLAPLALDLVWAMESTLQLLAYLIISKHHALAGCPCMTASPLDIVASLGATLA
ncbi:hypothetical protein HaLaN_29318, partial [Haematococcus lacustris]